MQTTTEEILQKLKRAGLKFTGKRRETVDFFVRHKDKYMSAKEVYEHLKEMYSNISYDTVYRTLATLLENNVIEHMEFRDGAARYRLMCHEEHHHHLVCLGCGSTFAIDTCPMADLSSEIGNFQVTNHRFEIYGYCSKCQAAS
ncbi:transcriptional repressor [Alicyclobacillus fastidiosus]|uniref:Transcriptional repressor n=1 Tax=Alicyclobacillus fastidiosus TaxID=392011 RepID=A0ABY6ZE43_9BACL|nr:Fur family transcriptional regulator [Alicyclobacillus fastidiosus]WAH41164.1 transcriptional repressor [Alicyclobacillus fastidiosus]GMA62739.1 transcriptional repressor [Alicyclobacillus fastidiosus]